MSRVPLRIRLSAIFTAVMALVLAGAGYITLTRFSEAQREYGPAVGPGGVIAQHAALADLRRELLTALPVVFIVAAIGAWLLAAAALRPVERLRAQAAAVTEDTPRQRLDVPPSRDEIARLAVTLNAMLHRLQTALDRERQFVADAGHELRTPLSLLHTEIELALRHPRDAAALRDALASAHEEALRLVQLTEDLLLLARTDHRPHPAMPAREPGTRVAPLLNRAAARLGNGSPGTQITVHCPDELTVHAAEGQLERAVTNMVHNALRHGAAPIQITAALRAGQAEIHVRDRGAGFPPAFLLAAFDRFTRADSARSGPGTGLGLAITAAIARAAGGSHGAANRPGGGADVWITLPAVGPPRR
jgi:signal transduction histidine kinase